MESRASAAIVGLACASPYMEINVIQQVYSVLLIISQPQTILNPIGR